MQTDYFYKLLGKWLFMLAFILTTLQLLVDYGSSNIILVIMVMFSLAIFLFVLVLELWYLVIPFLVKAWRRSR